MVSGVTSNTSGVTPYAAVAFDLLTGLLDSWTLWDRVAGSSAIGRAWRGAYLSLTYDAGAYVPYESLVAEAARAVGAPASLADALVAEWDSIEPWPDAIATLQQLAVRVPLAVVTNCSNVLAARAMAKLSDVPFVTCVTAEAVGAYKPDPRTYRRMLDDLGATPSETLFVAGSPFDIAGASSAGMSVYWHNRAGLVAGDQGGWPAGALIAEERTLRPLVERVRAGRR